MSDPLELPHNTLDDDALDPQGLETLGQERPDDVRLGSDEGDDEPVVPPDRQPRATEWGTTGAEEEQGETIEQRIAQEEPDPSSAYGAPDDESGLDGPAPLGGDDPDAIPAADDWLGESDSDQPGPSVRVVAEDEGDRPDTDAQAWARDVEFGEDGGTAEESAMHVIEED